MKLQRENQNYWPQNMSTYNLSAKSKKIINYVHIRNANANCQKSLHILIFLTDFYCFEIRNIEKIIV